MAVYEARHIICPLCDKGFVAILQALNYAVEGHEGRWEKLQCPKCDTEIFVSDTAKYALLAEDVKAEYKWISFR